jgi:branched-chain amino acid aminotransferase
MSFDLSKWVWINGEFARWGEVCVPVSAHTLHLGSGVFEAVRCYQTACGPAVFRLDAHLARLWRSAAVYQMEIPYTAAALARAVGEVVRRNEFGDCYVRLLCYHGSGSLGVYPRGCPVEVLLLCWPLGTYLNEGALEEGVRATISPWVKFHSRMMPTTAKACGQYLNSLLAMREAVGRGYDEAVLLDAEGNVAEGSGENIFVVRGGGLLTNDERSSILLGITRDSVIELARAAGYQVSVGTISPEELLAADEAFFTGTAAEVTPIREIDMHPVGAGRRGPVTERIQRAYFDATRGRDRRCRGWLSFIEGEGATVDAA